MAAKPISCGTDLSCSIAQTSTRSRIRKAARAKVALGDDGQYKGDDKGSHVEEPIITPWEEGRVLPLFLREPYAYRFSRIHGRDVLLMIVQTPQTPSPAVISKQTGVVRDRTGLEPIVVLPSLSSYNRKRFVERGVSFIVPDNQMYLAPLGIDFREHNRRSRPDVKTVQPATQCTIIALLSRRLPGNEYAPSVLAEKLRYSYMTFTRVFRELESISFGDQLVSGRMRILRLSGVDRHALWNHVLPYLSTPVKRTETVLLRKEPKTELPLSGISALAQHSNLSEPNRKTVAVNGGQWRCIQREGAIKEVPPTEEAATSVEVWKYSPHTWREIVDPLSLYLSLRDSPDERVQAALDLMLERFPW